MSGGGTARSRTRPAVRDGLAALDVRHLALAIHDASFPGGPEDDLGRGAPCSPAALRLVAFAATLGFDALQLGPQGLTEESDPSPYTGALFSRNPLSISLARLADPDDAWGGLLPRERLAALVAARPAGAAHRVPHPAVHRAQRSALGAAFERFERSRASGDGAARRLEERLEVFRGEAASWLEADALYETLRGEYRGLDWPHWQGPRAELDRALGEAPAGDALAAARRAELERRFAPALRFYRFVQLLAREQHERFRSEADQLGLQLFGDLQVGISPRDAWRHRGIFLRGYRLGAPPSRTNPEGQPWDYPVLDPDACTAAEGGASGPAVEFVTARMARMFADYDAVRIDHPQGLVCPWVYHADAADPLRAVQEGARLFSSPDLPDHPRLARFAIARREQLASDPSVRRYDDHWVRDLRPEQVDRYALLFDRVVEQARRLGGAEPALICEVLSTLPYPLERVLGRHDLGRFRVTQKADVRDPDDVYQAENAAARDWIMFGNHDTPPLWALLDDWRVDGRLAARAAHAAARLAATPDEREALRAHLLARPGLLAHAEIAQLFASPARHVSIFFADLFGLTETYNRPGTVSSENWSLRLGPDWREDYAARLREDRALNLPLALWLALRGRPEGASPELLRALHDEAERAREGPPLGASA